MAKKDNSQFDKANQEKPKLQPLISVKTFKSLQDIKNGDSFEEALRKLYLLMWENISTDREQQEIDGLFEEEAELNKARQHQQILEALFSLKEDKRSRQQKRQEERKETKKAEEPKKVEAPKTAEKVQKPSTPKTEPTVPKAEPVKTAEKTKPVEPKPSAEKAPTKAPAVSTASKVAIGAAGATGVFASSEAFAKTMMPEAERASKALGGKIPSVAILGQWAGESSNGKSVSAPFNYAGIKAGKNDKKGDYVLTEERYTDAQIKQAQASGETLHKVLGPDDKISKKGRQVTIDEWFGKGSIAKAQSEGKQWVQVKSYFAKFDSPEEFTDRYVQFLSSSRYAKARESTTPAQFGLEVAKAGYATASADHYSAGISDYASKYPSLSSASPASAPSSGAKIDQSSKENKDLKKPSAGGVTVINNTNNNIVKGGNQETVITNKPNDKPQLLQQG